MNTLMTASASGIFAGSAHRPKVQTFVTSLAAVYSFVIGLVFLFGTSDKLPPLVH
jgi:high-affinity nickel-transport protein